MIEQKKLQTTMFNQTLIEEGDHFMEKHLGFPDQWVDDDRELKSEKRFKTISDNDKTHIM